MPNLKSGSTFAGCRIIDVCGHGGFGTVYLAENAVGKRVAVKIINAPDKRTELNGIRCYMAAAPQSPHLLPIIHAGIENDELFYIMEAADPLDGDSPHYIADTLGRRLKIAGRLTPEAALKIARDIAGAVGALHRAGLIHRDIKPDNIIFVGGEAMLSDPGLLSSVECSASLAGTLGFLPPECFYGEENNSIASDIYALGKVFYCALSGESPGRYPRLPRELGTTLCRKLLPVLLRACNEKKEKRFADIDEMLHSLPEKLPSPGRLERFGEEFRIWRLMHARLWNGILAATLLLAALGGYGAYRAVRSRRETAREYAGMRAAVAEVRRRFDAGGERLRLQLVRALGQTGADKLLSAVETIPGRPAEARKRCREIDGRLHSAAETLVCAAWRIEDPLRRSGKLRDLLDSPLGACLTDAEKKNLKKSLDADENKHHLIRPWHPSPGRVYYPDSSLTFEFAYIPPGEFVSPRTKKTIRIDYPMWVGVTELSVRQFSRICRYVPAGNRELDLPVTRVVWNDLLFGCERAGHIFSQLSPLPPGYIVRPLTEDEWEYCALAGMRPTPPDAAAPRTAKRELARPGSGRANPFGLYDLPGNVRESVISDQRGNRGSYVVRGGSFMSNGENLSARRNEIAFYQSFMPDTGTRLAIAPGSQKLFEREFRWREVGHLHHGGKHYEFFGHLCANFGTESSRAICALLGGRPARLEDPKVLTKLAAIASPTMVTPVFVDAEFRDGRWRWCDGEALKMKIRAPKPGERLILQQGKFQLQRLERAPCFICEWSDEEWEHRRDLSAPERRGSILAEFRLDGRKYMLIHARGYPHLARRYAEILGGRLAEPETPEMRRRIAEKLGVRSTMPAFVGGIWKRGSYRWLTSGNVIDGELRTVGTVTDNARSLATPALVGDELCAAQQAENFLVEFPTE